MNTYCDIDVPEVAEQQKNEYKHNYDKYTSVQQTWYHLYQNPQFDNTQYCERVKHGQMKLYINIVWTKEDLQIRVYIVVKKSIENYLHRDRKKTAPLNKML